MQAHSALHVLELSIRWVGIGDRSRNISFDGTRDEGVLIVGSGMSYHNMRTLMTNMRGGANGPSPDSGSQRFDDWLEDVLTREAPEARVVALAAWDKAPAARDAHSREEHLLPLHVVVGAAGNDPGRRTLKDVVMGAVESAFRFG